jgi:hypothetical protein
MPDDSLDQRMTAMEEAVRELQDMMKARKPAPDWLDRVIGFMKDEPAFDDRHHCGRQSGRVPTSRIRGWGQKTWCQAAVRWMFLDPVCELRFTNAERPLPFLLVRASSF